MGFKALFSAVQVPGFTRSNDLSQYLQTHGYFGSCTYGDPMCSTSVQPRADNVAFDPFIRQVSGYDAQAEVGGPLYVYGKAPRGLIFARDAPHVERQAEQCLVLLCHAVQH